MVEMVAIDVFVCPAGVVTFGGAVPVPTGALVVEALVVALVVVAAAALEDAAPVRAGMVESPVTVNKAAQALRSNSYEQESEHGIPDKRMGRSSYIRAAPGITRAVLGAVKTDVAAH
jgi:hypothetical protein